MDQIDNKHVVLRVTDTPGFWKLEDEFTATISGREFTVPAGFITDLASIPRFFWRILPPFGRYTAAAVLHDYLYSEQFVPRDKADWVFMMSMKALNVHPIKVAAMYRAVRMFGRRAWKNKTTRQQQQ